MSLYIQTNVASMLAQNHLAQTQKSLSTSFARLSSGYRINSAADDAAGLGMAKSINAQVHSYGVAERNANDGISMAQTADGGAEQIHALLTRMRELAVQGSNGALTTNDSANLDTEFQAALSEIDRIATSTQFNGKNLLSGAAADLNIQVGIGTDSTDQIGVSFGGADATRLHVSGLSVSSVTGAQAALSGIDDGIQALNSVRAGFGAAMNRFGYAVANLQTIQTNMSASLSRIQDVDIASETAALAREQVLAQGGASVLGQANQSPQLALGLLQGR